MAYDSTAFDQFKQALNGRTGQPIVLGVGQALAKRLNIEPWLTRTTIIVAGLLFSFLTLAVYIGLGFVMNETHDRTSGFFRGLWMTIKEKCCCVSNRQRRHSHHY